MDGHDEHLVAEAEVGEHGLGGSFGIERDGGAEPERADAGKLGVEVAVGLHVDLDRLRAGGGERLKVEVGTGEHQVDVAKEAWCDAAAERDDVWAEGEVRHEVRVHDVDVQGVGAGRLGAADLIG